MFNYLSIVAGVFYVALGVFVIFYKFFVIQLEPLTSYLLGALLIVYGIFRILRAINHLKKNQQNEV